MRRKYKIIKFLKIKGVYMYYLIFLIGIILSIINDRKKFSFKIYFIILLFLSFFRFGVGPDYFAYNVLYKSLSGSIITELKYGL